MPGLPGTDRGEQLLVSVCIANHNYGRYVGWAIDSALGQTYPYIEVVVVDDGSTDDSVEVARGYGDRIVLIEQENAGQGAAISAALARASGDVVFFLDADDELRPTIAADVVEVFERRSDVVDVQFLIEWVDDDGDPTGRILPRHVGLLASGDVRKIVLERRSYPAQVGGGHAYRRAALLPAFPIPGGEYRSAADGYLAEIVPLLGPLHALDRVGYGYRIHGSNDSLRGALDGAYFRERMDRICRAHAHVARVAAVVGIAGVSEDVRTPLDPAFLCYSLASLRLDPAAHPFPSDRRLRLAARGLRAAITHPLLSGRSKVVRSVWFVGVGLLPRRWADRLISDLTPDVPRSTRTHHRSTTSR